MFAIKIEYAKGQQVTLVQNCSDLEEAVASAFDLADRLRCSSDGSGPVPSYVKIYRGASLELSISIEAFTSANGSGI